MNHRIPRCIAACLLASACAAQATELVYTPVNPAFGGNPLNGTWLLNNAQAQNDYDDPDLKDRASAFTGTTALERFSNDQFDLAVIQAPTAERAEAVIHQLIRVARQGLITRC